MVFQRHVWAGNLHLMQPRPQDWLTAQAGITVQRGRVMMTRNKCETLLEPSIPVQGPPITHQVLLKVPPHFSYLSHTLLLVCPAIPPCSYSNNTLLRGHPDIPSGATGTPPLGTCLSSPSRELLRWGPHSPAVALHSHLTRTRAS